MYASILAAENGRLFPHDMNEFYWGSAAFICIVSLLVWLVGPVAKKGLAGRSAKIEAQLQQAEVQRKAAADQVAALTTNLAGAEQESARIVADARQRAEQITIDLKAKAEADVAEAKRRAHVEIQASKSQSLADLRAEVAAMTVSAAEAVIDANLTDTVRSDLIDNYIQQVGASR